MTEQCRKGFLKEIQAQYKYIKKEFEIVEEETTRTVKTRRLKHFSE